MAERSAPNRSWKRYLPFRLGQGTPPFSIDQIPDLTGKVAIVTGANTGLGYETMLALASRGAHVFLACRSEKRALNAIKTATAEIKSRYAKGAVDTSSSSSSSSSSPPTPILEFLELDLKDIRKTYQAAQEFLKRDLPLHILVNNSGRMFASFQLSNDGIEAMFAINYLGHYVFTMTLLDRIKASQPSRIVNVSSMAHRITPLGGINFETLNQDDIVYGFPYGRSKLAIVLFTKALARRLAGEQVYVNTLHPGYVQTSIGQSTVTKNARLYKRMAASVGAWIIRKVGLSPGEGALTQLYLATSPEVEEKDLRGSNDEDKE
ncbi:hypothetical protein BGZ95_008498 [Linnemannia exigua]|uniref:NAD(P)-binding protein n=1 Tax=Linnemannia exigua TaxID=604196 RepID=A0AAD4HBR3_9FUNG|nr:hypothetical protein BGZ95_008498 [Linnemannia exigua]